MAVYIYCVLPGGAAAPPEDLRGVDGASVRALEAASLAVWVSDVPERAPVVTAARAIAHDDVIRRALEGTTPIPARFGQTAESGGEVVSAIAARRSEYASALKRVEGAVEMTVRVLLDAGVAAAEASAPAEPAGAGRAYLDRIRREQQVEHHMRDSAQRLRDEISSVVRDLVREEAWAPLLPGARALSVSHLVARALLPPYRAAVRELMRVEPDLRVMVSGPWAPYSFTPFHDA